MPRVQEYPIRVVRFSGNAYSDGIEQRNMDRGEVAVYSIPEAVADCFKYRNKIGLDVATEALKDVIRGKRALIDEQTHFAEV